MEIVFIFIFYRLLFYQIEKLYAKKGEYRVNFLRIGRIDIFLESYIMLTALFENFLKL